MSKKTLYMHINTGSIDTRENWECDIEQSNKMNDRRESFSYLYVTGTLIEVDKNGNEI